jgi:NAD(P)-dependent dehydrogenase (short-subunit alcohol dehydrogenase family)
MDDMTGRVALVTGSSSGIGAACARGLADAGARVVVNSRSSAQQGRAVAAEIGGDYLQADVSDPVAARALIDQVVDRHGRLDVLVNNAATTEMIPHHDLDAATPEVWHRLYATNVVAPFVLVAAALPALQAAPGGAVVVNVGSLAGLRPLGSSIPYAASKAALHHTSLLLAGTFGPQVRFNVVAPGFTETPWTADWNDTRAYVGQVAPMRRGATPEDVADAVVFLARSSYLTGEMVVVDGGLQLR